MLEGEGSFLRSSGTLSCERHVSMQRSHPKYDDRDPVNRFSEYDGGLAWEAGCRIAVARRDACVSAVRAAGSLLMEKVAGKGGGTRDFARGRLNDGPHAEKAVSLARELLPVSAPEK